MGEPQLPQTCAIRCHVGNAIWRFLFGAEGCEVVAGWMWLRINQTDFLKWTPWRSFRSQIVCFFLVLVKRVAFFRRPDSLGGFRSIQYIKSCVYSQTIQFWDPFNQQLVIIPNQNHNFLCVFFFPAQKKHPKNLKKKHHGVLGWDILGNHGFHARLRATFCATDSGWISF